MRGGATLLRGFDVGEEGFDLAIELAGFLGQVLGGIAGPGRLDGGFQCQEVGLFGDAFDQVDNFANLI